MFSGDDYEAYIAKNILMPLDMRETFFDRAPYHLVAHGSHSYVRDAGGLREQRFDFDTAITVERRPERAHRRHGEVPGVPGR